MKNPTRKEIDDAAYNHAKNHSNAPDKEIPSWIMTDFKAGVNWILEYQKMQLQSGHGGPSWDEVDANNR